MCVFCQQSKWIFNSWFSWRTVRVSKTNVGNTNHFGPFTETDLHEVYIKYANDHSTTLQDAWIFSHPL